MIQSKKKINEELILYFPDLFNDVSTREYYDDLYYRTMLILDSIIDEVDNKEEIEKITTSLITYNKPMIFWGAESIEITQDREYDNMRLLISQKTNVDTSSFTVRQYYNAFNYIRKQDKPIRKAK